MVGDEPSAGTCVDECGGVLELFGGYVHIDPYLARPGAARQR